MKNRTVMSFLTLVLTMALALSAAAEIKVGAGTGDMTPDPSRMRVTTGGYGKFLGHVAKSVHDPILAKALVLESAGKKLAWVAIDTVEVSNELREESLRRLRGTAFNNDNLFICATHTHAAPGAMEKIIVADLAFGPYSQKVVDIMAEGIAQAVKQADAALRPARLNIALDKSPGLTRNRRVDYYNYDTRRFSKPYDPKTEPTTDDTITVLRIDSQDGKPFAIVVHFATHGTTLGPNNTALSADWPGVMRKEIEARYPGAMVMYVNGAEGDQAPDEADIPDDFQAMEIFGKRVAEAALPLVAKAEPFNAEPMKSKIEWIDTYYPAKAEGIRFPKSLTHLWFREMPLSVVRLGDLVLLGVPLEAISEIGLTAKESARGLGYKYPLFIGLMNHHYMYATTPAEYRKGGYEAGNTMYGEMEAGFLIGELLLVARELR
jgi:hypothetical protein